MLAPDDDTIIEVQIDGIATGWHYPRWMLSSTAQLTKTGATVEVRSRPWARPLLFIYITAIALFIDWGWIKPRGFGGSH
jgi:hypothetical protein